MAGLAVAVAVAVGSGIMQNVKSCHILNRTAMQLQARDHRWLGQIAVEAGRLHAKDLPPLNPVTAQEAWAAVATAAGMDQEALAALVATHHRLPLAHLDGVDTTPSARLPGRLAAGRSSIGCV